MPVRTRSAIVGVGTTDFSKDSGRSEQRLAMEAVLAAVADAGLEPSDVDGFTTFTMDNTRSLALAIGMGLRQVRYFAETPYGGGGGCGAVMLASLAVETRQADVVVVYRAFNERSQLRFGQPYTSNPNPDALATNPDLDKSWALPVGYATPASILALSARRYMHDHGATSEDFGRVSVSARKHASTNPNAFFYGKPITLEDHQNSRLIADPLRLFDCCMESDAGVAFVVVSADRAKDHPRAVAISAAAQAFANDQYWVGNQYREDIAESAETRIVGGQLWEQSGLTPRDMDLACLYDHFSPAVLFQLEALGFCERGAAPAFIKDRGIDVGQELPVNPHGGQIGEAYVHGMNGIAEAIRQLRGTAANQVTDAEHAVVVSGSHVPTSGLVLSRI